MEYPEDFGPPATELVPSMFEEYHGHEIDEFLICRSAVLYNALYKDMPIPENTDIDAEHYNELLRRRHRALQAGDPEWKLQELAGLGDRDLELRLWDIQDIWSKYYLEPRLGPIGEDLQLDWLQHCVASSQDIRFGHVDAQQLQVSVALTDIVLPPLYSKPVDVLSGQSVKVSAPHGLGSSRLLDWSDDRPVKGRDENSTRETLAVPRRLIRRLMYERGIDENQILDAFDFSKK